MREEGRRLVSLSFQVRTGGGWRCEEKVTGVFMLWVEVFLAREHVYFRPNPWLLLKI